MHIFTNKRSRILMGMTLGLGLFAMPAYSDEIEGNWTTQSGDTAAISSCGSSFCITLQTGEFAGKQIGQLALEGTSYNGTILDPTDDKEYSGSATITGSTMQLKGCTMVVFCKTQAWQKQ